MNAAFWNGKRVLLTGPPASKEAGSRYGYKSSAHMSLACTAPRHCMHWACTGPLTGHALAPSTNDRLFRLAAVGEQMKSKFEDIRDADKLDDMLQTYRPEIVFHLAAQTLVRQSYVEPLETYDVNVMGTIHLLEADPVAAAPQ